MSDTICPETERAIALLVDDLVAERLAVATAELQTELRVRLEQIMDRMNALEEANKLLKDRVASLTKSADLPNFKSKRTAPPQEPTGDTRDIAPPTPNPTVEPDEVGDASAFPQLQSIPFAHGVGT